MSKQSTSSRLTIIEPAGQKKSSASVEEEEKLNNSSHTEGAQIAFGFEIHKAMNRGKKYDEEEAPEE